MLVAPDTPGFDIITSPIEGKNIIPNPYLGYLFEVEIKTIKIWSEN